MHGHEHIGMTTPRPSPDAVRPETVDRVVAASMATSGDSVYAQMERIRAAALRHNVPAGVHGVLVYLSGWYLLWIEGPSAAVRDALRRVARDPRHHSPRVLHFSHGPRLLPTPWSMMMLPATEPMEVVGRRVDAVRALLLRGRQFAPTSVLRRVAAPFSLPLGEGASDPESFHRVGICAAESAPAFGLVRWVASQQGQPTRHRRVAGEEGLDAGMDQIDIVVDGQACRLNALPWQSLVHGLLRVYLPEWQHMLLVFGGSLRGDETLMQRMVKAAAALPEPTSLLASAPDDETHVRMAALAAPAGLPYEPIAVAASQDYAVIWRALAAHLLRLGPPAGSDWAVPDGALLELAA